MVFDMPRSARSGRLSVHRPCRQHGAGLCDVGAPVYGRYATLTGDGLSEMLRVDCDVDGLLSTLARLLDAQQRCSLAGVCDVRAGESRGERGEFGGEMVGIDASGQLQPIHVMQKDGLSSLLVGRAHPDYLVKTPRTT